ncbi:MAG: 3'-5' exonuclease [Parasporobacterium sp.]|nr:3'-5' exonuclease [Parasporobacterium sp.]
MKCIVCGKETDGCLCENCRTEADLEKLCKEIIAFRPGTGEKPLWEELSGELNSPYNFRNLVFSISDDLPTPRKEYLRTLTICGNSSNVPKASRPWFYEIYDAIRDHEDLSVEEKSRIDGIALGALYMDYDYSQADRIATILCESEDLPWQCYYNLAEFYTNTRRYEVAQDLITEALQKYSNDPFVVQTMQNREDKNKKQMEKAASGKQEYLPAPKENKEEIRKKYVDFLKSIGIDAELPTPKRKSKDAIPVNEYPKPVETDDPNFDTFVAFDLETTGKSSKIDSIIEIGAVKVVNGKVIESTEYIFQELVQPLDYKKVSVEITKLTGITNDEVYSARPIWEVFPDFMKFAGDAVLVGFNCMSFDSRFVVRAGRYSNLIIDNKYFDVMRYVRKFREQIDSEMDSLTLGNVSQVLNIENPRAHRALADAITTAKVFLKLKEMDKNTEGTTIDDILSDLGNW